MDTTAMDTTAMDTKGMDTTPYLQRALEYIHRGTIHVIYPASWERGFDPVYPLLFDLHR